MPSTPANRSSRSGSKAMVILKLSPKLLSQFTGTGKSPTPKGKEEKEEKEEKKQGKDVSPTSTTSDPPPRPSSVDNASDAASTPANGADRRKSNQPAKAGTKRPFNQAGEPSKSRGRSRKKPKVEDGAEPKPAATGHRLGPKANTGAINAQLRALDRSGAQCRKWERKPLHLKSFTGIQWQLASWRAPKDHKVETNGDAPKDVALDVGDSDSKANHSISAVPSEKSNSGVDGEITPVVQRVVESPSPAIAAA